MKKGRYIQNLFTILVLLSSVIGSLIWIYISGGNYNILFYCFVLTSFIACNFIKNKLNSYKDESDEKKEFIDSGIQRVSDCPVLFIVIGLISFIGSFLFKNLVLFAIPFLIICCFIKDQNDGYMPEDMESRFEKRKSKEMKR